LNQIFLNTLIVIKVALDLSSRAVAQWSDSLPLRLRFEFEYRDIAEKQQPLQQPLAVLFSFKTTRIRIQNIFL